ncbi:restriction endonuclease subunit S [Mycolicibacterium septicum]|uniref:restriction endonuclease subunit S n=1 Tax=Mycolicibacterium septicum TaxID=98668 RepID=UPI001AF36317|nr:restriction endonuclease subunit S [Mycolicibacterium septicum]QRY53799.1 restriction endonuclease subunit S [Mycolicibacterium septicum]
MTVWTTFSVRDVAQVFDGPHATPTKTDSGPWYLSISSLKRGRFDFSESAHLGEIDLPRWTRRVMPQPGDTLFSYETRLGEAAYWSHSFDSALGRRMGLLRPNPAKVDPRYLSYVYLGPEFQSTIRENTLSGATVDRIPVGEMPSWPIRLPDLDNQRRIAAILGAVDDLIENDRRRMEILEEMARRIYLEWFVKFCYPGHGDVPLVDSALGPIPEGWAVHPPSAIVNYHIGGGWGTEKDEPDSEVPGYVIRGTDIPRVAHLDVSTVPFRFHRQSNFQSRNLQHGDIVFEVSGGSKGQPVGRSLLVRQHLLDRFDAPAMCASFCKLVRADHNAVEPSILIRLLQHAYASGELDAYQVQSTGITNFRWKPFLEHFSVVLPPKRQQEQMAQTFDQLDDQIANLGRKVGVLSRIRDLLLPKLVTGHIDVSTLDLDALLDEAVA